jgi:hypothetical protein
MAGLFSDSAWQLILERLQLIGALNTWTRWSLPVNLPPGVRKSFCVECSTLPGSRSRLGLSIAKSPHAALRRAASKRHQ